MGIVSSLIRRQSQRFNVESRAQRIIDKEKPTPAPKYDSNLYDMERTLELDPDFVKNLNTRDSSLDERLKNVYVTSKDSFIDMRNADPHKPLPLSRTTPDDFEYGFKEPEPNRVPPGRVTLRQAMQFITDNTIDEELWTSKKIADEYKLKQDVVDHILCYFKTFNVYIPNKQIGEKILKQSEHRQIDAPKD